MARNAQRYIGVDMGGTKILALLVDADGEIVHRFKLATRTDGTPLSDQIVASVEGVLSESGCSQSEVQGIGVGVPGVVDSQRGLFVTAPNLAIDDHNLAQTLRERLGGPVMLGNDVNLGTLAEVCYGAGRGARTAVGMFVGTGIGGGVVIGGRLCNGAEDLAGEIGHMVLMVDGPKCGCGNKGCFEAIASRTAVEREIRAAVAQGRPCSLEKELSKGRIRSSELAKALSIGDDVVTEVMTRVAHYLAQGVLSIRHLLDPDLIILGGGLFEACGEFLLPLVEREVRADPLTGSRDVLRLVLSQLGDDAVALGAAALVREQLGNSVFNHRESSDKYEVIFSSVEGPKIDSVEFGSIRVDGKEYPHDLHIRADGKIKKRRKSRLRKLYGSSHMVDAEELKSLCKGEPDLIIIGTGFQGMVRLTDDAQAFLSANQAEHTILPTPEAVKVFNNARRKRALLIHVTC